MRAITALTERLLARCLPVGPVAEGALGDLQEELEARAGGDPPWRAFLWYAREACSLAWAFRRERRRQRAVLCEARAREGRRGDTIMRILFEDLRFAARALARRPIFVAVVVATLALGIGGNVALFSVVDGVLLRRAGLLVRSFWKLQRVDPGYDPRGLLLAKLSFAGPGFEFPKSWPVNDWPAQSAFTETLASRLEANPAVRSVAFAHQGPTDPGWTTRVTVEGRPAPAPGEQDEASFRPVSASYFRTLGIPLERGRDFGHFDGPGRQLVAIVNDAFVARHLPNDDPVGHRISVFGLPREIVGVVRGERFEGLEAGPAPAMYLPLAQNPQPALTVMLRTTADPFDLAPALREAVRGLDPTLALFELGTAEQALARSLEERRFTLLLLGAFAAVALTLAAVGIYGVVSFAVSERTREMGVRIALGAEPRHVFRMVVRQGLGLSFAAIAAGTVLALGLGRVMERLLFGVEARDPLTFAAVAVLLLPTAFTASAVPALRATRVDPTTALRAE